VHASETARTKQRGASSVSTPHCYNCRALPGARDSSGSRMERSANAKLHIGAWTVDPASGEISRGGETARLEVRAMRLLVCLAERPGEVVSIDDLLDQVWSGVIVSPDSVYQAVASLRRVLGDDSREPTYIATVPRLGYRMVATVRPWLEVPNVQSTERSGDFRAPTSQPRFGLGLG